MIEKKFKVPVALFPKEAKATAKASGILIKSAPNGLTYDRIGVTFRAKTVKTAALRNKIKRAVFDSFGVLAGKKIKKEQGGKDHLVILDSLAEKLSKEDLIKIFKNGDII